jgi:hypothetical protein
VYLPYQILRNLGPQDITTAHQREVDDQLGRVVAALTRRVRSPRPTMPCGRTGAGSGAPSAGRVSKGGRNTAGTRGIVRPAA